MADEKRIAEIEARMMDETTPCIEIVAIDTTWLIAELRASQAECAKLEGIYASAVNGRAEMRTALKEERAKRPLGITEWSTVENVERVIAERDALKAKLAEAVAHLEAAVNDANRQKDQHERLRVSLAVALGLLSEMEYWRQLTGTRFEAPLRNFLADMRAGR